jgi:hypothetical protein
MADPSELRCKEIEAQAASILKELGLYRLPVDPFEIARMEGIKFSPGAYNGCFDARLEFHREKQLFFCFYADERTGRTEGRIRFTIGHELGHFYLEEHRRYLTAGYWHGSQTGFVSDNRLEREADRFSAGLLMPAELFRAQVHRFRQRVCTLKDIMTLADRLKVSITATAIRYCELDIEASSVILSRNGRVLFHVPSYDMKSLGFGFIKKGSAIPMASRTAQLLKGDSREPVGGETEGEVWYESRSGTLWEEATRLGATDLVLTYLTHEAEDED